MLFDQFTDVVHQAAFMTVNMDLLCAEKFKIGRLTFFK